MEAAGGRLGATIAGANGHDLTLLAATLEASVVARPQPHLGLATGDEYATGHETGAASPYIQPLRRRGADTPEPDGRKTPPARRGVVARTLAWLSRGWGFRVREAKKAVNVFGLRQRAWALLWRRRRARFIGARESF